MDLRHVHYAEGYTMTFFLLYPSLDSFRCSSYVLQAELQYVLYAVVVHIGLRPTSGHYYCFIRLSSDTWCKFDDSMVHCSILCVILFYNESFTLILNSLKEWP